MHTPEEQAWFSSDLQQEIEVENVTDHRANRPRGSFCIVIRHPDVSSSFSVGPFDVPGAPVGILQAIIEAIPELLRHLEVGIPDPRSASLSSNGFWDSVFREELVESHMVRDSRVG